MFLIIVYDALIESCDSYSKLFYLTQHSLTTLFSNSRNITFSSSVLKAKFITISIKNIFKIIINWSSRSASKNPSSLNWIDFTTFSISISLIKSLFIWLHDSLFKTTSFLLIKYLDNT